MRGGTPLTVGFDDVANIDLSGGHIRNVVLAAAAHSSGRAITLDDLRAALEAEYRKLGRQMPGTASLFKP